MADLTELQTNEDKQTSSMLKILYIYISNYFSYNFIITLFLLFIQAQVLIRNVKYFDTKRTTYEILKMIMDNKFASGLNVNCTVYAI